MREAMLTLFTIPKPFEGDVAVIQRNALASWLRLGAVQVIICGDEAGSRDVAAEFGIERIPHVECNEFGTPLLNSTFSLAQKRARFGLTCYANADLILFPDFAGAVGRVARSMERFLVVGETWNVDVTADYSTLDERTAERARRELSSGGTVRLPNWVDFFVFPTGSIGSLPPFTVGRPGWDNWKIHRARSRRIPVVDISPSVRVVHQQHDYRHVPNARGARWEGPEGDRNLDLPGVRLRSDFSLRESTHLLTPAGLVAAPRQSTRARLRTFLLITPGLAHTYHPLRALARIGRQAVGAIRREQRAP
jgi:hypothetical protein